MNSFKKWMQGLYDEEPLMEQRERLAKKCLHPDTLKDREKHMKIKQEPKQLKLF